MGRLCALLGVCFFFFPMVMMWSNPALTSIWARSFMLMLPRRRILAGGLVLVRGRGGRSERWGKYQLV